SPGRAVNEMSSSTGFPSAKTWHMRSNPKLAAKLTPAGVARACLSVLAIDIAGDSGSAWLMPPRAASIIPCPRSQQTELLEIDVGQRILVVGRPVIVRDGHGKRRRHARRQQAGALELVQPRQVAQRLQ